MNLVSIRIPWWVGIAVLTAVLPQGPSRSRADETDPENGTAASNDRQREIAAELLQSYCLHCHTGDSAEASVQLDALDLSFGTASDHQLLQRVLRVVSSREMPPPDAKSPDSDQRQRLVTYLERRLEEVAQKRRRSGARTSNRRLTVDEYNFTMQRLFGVDAEFREKLPPDPVSPEGYQNHCDLLVLSSPLMECYLDSARQAVDRYVQFGPPAQEPVRYHIEFEDLYYNAADRYGTRERAPRPVDQETFQARRSANRAASPKYVGPLSPIPPGRFPTDEELRPAIPKLHQRFVALPEYASTGEMIVRLHAAATADRNGRFPRMRVETGITLGDGCSMDTRVLGEVDVTAPREDPAVFEFRIRTENVPSKGPLDEQETVDRLSVFDMLQVFISNVTRDEQAIYALGPAGYRDTQANSEKAQGQLDEMAQAGVNFLYLDCIEIEMLPARGVEPSYAWSVDMAETQRGEQQAERVASELLASFMRQAYRRPLIEGEVAQKMALFHTLRNRGDSFEESLRGSLSAVLISPAFLFLDPTFHEASDQSSRLRDAYTLASRLSYLLWQEPPDERLLGRADDGSLLEQDGLLSEAERMLDDPRSRRFLDDFCRQWLRLDKHRNIAVDPQHHPHYDDDLGQATIQETLDFFAEVFASDASVLDLIDCDYAIINDRLAEHYELDTITDGDLHKTPLPKDSIRGGLLTQASLLTANSNGRESHPIRRGVWLLDRLLNTPPPPPPPNVPDLEPDAPSFQGLSLKKQIELHREPGACQSCHRKIDPWGLALENLDATGRWREEIRVEGQSTLVDAEVELPDGKRIGGIRELKRHLRQERHEMFASALVHHMLTYTFGRSPDYADRQQIDQLHQRFVSAGYRLRELVLAIIDSPAFRPDAETNNQRKQDAPSQS